MKTNTFAARVTVAALCAAASALATPAHAQWAFQKSVVSSVQDNSSSDTGNANHGEDDAPGFLAVTAGGHGDAASAAQADGNYDMTEVQTFVWNGPGTPTDITYTEKDTLSATASAVPGSPSGPYNSSATANVADNYASAHVDFYRWYDHPSDSPAPFETVYISGTSGQTTYESATTLNATASRYGGTGGDAFAAQGKAQTSFSCS